MDHASSSASATGARDWLEIAARGGGNELREALLSWVTHQFLADWFARLEQAGHASEGRIPLARVFTDLPARRAHRYPEEEVPEEEPAEGEPLPPGFLAELLAATPERIWPGRSNQLALPFRDDVPERSGPVEEQHGGYLLIGGPGQGKSTCGQFACQLHRAALLRPCSGALAERARTAITTFREHRLGDALGEPVHPCFPLRIVLSDLAEDLAGRAGRTERVLLTYLCARLRKATGAHVQETALRAFLIEAPWLLVLDGLDEVPQGEVRAAVTEAVRWFLADLGEAGARGLLVATTRSQGYRGELGWLSPRHLAPLSKRRALVYAERLCRLRFPDDVERREHVLRTLERASQEGETAALLRTPLQITLMTTLVDQGGRPPRERWRLFHEYYRVFYAREMEREIPAAALLRDLRPQIDAIHRHAGLLLQAESEHARGARARMSMSRFEEVVDQTLAAEDFDDATRVERTRRIVEVALDRLVFLVPVEDGRIGFELRSLQELMAAEAITSGREVLVKKRLTAIAGSHAFRNVFLFAASKCFASPDFWHLRDHLVKVCKDLNAGAAGEVLQVNRMGSEIALDLLEEGVAREAPRYRQQLSEVALELLDLPPSRRQRRMVELLPPSAEDALREALSERLGRPVFEERLGAWIALATCVERGREWARTLGDVHWPESARERKALCDMLWVTGGAAAATAWWLEKAASVADSFGPDDLGDSLLPTSPAEGPDVEAARPWFPAAVRCLQATKRWSPILLTVRAGSLRMYSFLAPVLPELADRELARRTSLEQLSTIPPRWRIPVVQSHFLCSPGASMLATVLEHLADQPPAALSRHDRNHTLWPLLGCLLAARTPADRRELAKRLREGQLGDLDDWRAAEARWASGLELDLDDLRTAAPWPESSDACTALPPVVLQAALLEGDPATRAALIEQVLALWTSATSAARRLLLAKVCLELLRDSANWEILSRPTLQSLLGEDPDTSISLDAIVLKIAAVPDDKPAWIELLRDLVSLGRLAIRGPRDDLLGLVRLLSPFLRADEPDPLVEVLYQASDVDGGQPFPLAMLPALERVSPLRAAMVRAQRGFDVSQAEGLAAAVASAIDNEPRERWHAWQLSLLHTHGDDSAAQAAFDLELNEALSPRHWAVRSVLSIFQPWHWSRVADLAEPAVWEGLGFRPPSPNPQRESDPPPRPGRARVESITLTSLRPFEHHKVEIPANEADGGQWIVFLGDNGVGKSTLLRGVALALAHPDVAKAVLATSTAPYVRAGYDAAEAVVRLDGHTFRARLDRSEGAETVTSSGENGARRPLVFAYGCGRGSALGGADREVDFPPLSDVATLFHEGASLIHAETWLKQLRLGASLNAGTLKEKLYETVIGALLDLLPDVKSIDVREDGVWFEGPGVGRAPLTALSDGYLTTLGWAADMMARWLHHAGRLKLPIEPDFPSKMEGLVLVDEIDLHLHPTWQRRVIEDVRGCFRRMSFIVTTHNPLTLLGAEDGEIFTLRRREGGELDVQPMPAPRGLRADQVLTGGWFGLPTTLDADTLARLEEHRRMLERGVPEVAPDRAALEQLLKERLRTFPDTSVERLVQSVAAEILDETYPEASPEKRAEVRRRLKERARRRLVGDGGA